MKTIIIVPSMIELRHMLPEMGKMEPGPVMSWRVNDQLFALGGIGPAAAATTSMMLIQKHNPERLILAGIAGAFKDSGFQPGDLVQANSECFADLGHLKGDTWNNLDTTGLDMLPLRDQTFGCAYPLPLLDSQWPAGTALTVSTVTSDEAGAQALYHTYNAALENMEGAAIALVSQIHQIPFYQIRAVSNRVGPRNPRSWLVEEPLRKLRHWLDQRLG